MKFPVLLVVAANCLWKALRPLGLSIGKKYWKTRVEAWISRHVKLYYITTCLEKHVANVISKAAEEHGLLP